MYERKLRATLGTCFWAKREISPRVPGWGGCRQGMWVCVRSAAVVGPAVMFIPAPPTGDNSCHLMNTEQTIKENYYNQNNKYFWWGSLP